MFISLWLSVSFLVFPLISSAHILLNNFSSSLLFVSQTKPMSARKSLRIIKMSIWSEIIELVLLLLCNYNQNVILEWSKSSLALMKFGHSCITEILAVGIGFYGRFNLMYINFHGEFRKWLLIMALNYP